jgi:hypothetical protein
VVAAWLAKQSEPWQVLASVSQGGRREEIKGKEKKEKGKRAAGQENGLYKVGPNWRLGPRRRKWNWAEQRRIGLREREEKGQRPAQEKSTG